MKTIGAVAKKEFLNIQISNPYAFILSRLAISLSTIVITKCFSLFFSNQGDKSFQYVTAGVISYNISLSIIMAIGRSLMNERKFQTFSGLTLANVKYEQYFIGVFFGNLPYISIETFILLISSKALGLKLLLSNVSVFIPILMIVIVGYSLGTLMALLMLFMKDNACARLSRFSKCSSIISAFMR